MDYNSYIGLPYESNGRTRAGVDCWGLVRLFYAEQLHIELPDYSELYSGAWDPELSSVIELHKSGWAETSDAQPGDVCLFNIYGEPAHVGVYLGNRKFLHAREGRDSVVESLDSHQWSRRFGGFYRYSSQAQAVPATGLPHPLRTQVELDWMPAGTTVQDFADYVNNKYQISERLASKLVVLVDGVPIPRDEWSTTVLKADQKLAYKSVAEGRGGTRLLLTLAVVVAAAYFAPMLAPEAAAAVKAGTATFAQTATLAATTAAINMAGMALVNAIAPIRMPGQNDPGQARGLNLFTGASNQANRFGAIPVVLGRLRVTGTLGATPYVDTLTDTSLLNLLIIWGFGPLQVTNDSICVGTNPIKNYYNQPLTDAEIEQNIVDYNKKGIVNQTPEFAQDIPRPVTLQGSDSETPEETAAFNVLYPRDVEQQQVGVELVNNVQDGNPWQEVVLQQANTSELDIALSFPQGMRQIVTSGEHAGDIREATAGVEIQVRKFNTSTQTWPEWSPLTSYRLDQNPDNSGVSQPYTDQINPVVYVNQVLGTGDSGWMTETVTLYQWHTYALSSTGEIKRFDGTATESPTEYPSEELQQSINLSSYGSLLIPLSLPSNYNGYSHLPQIPQAGYIKLYTICNYAGAITQTINHLDAYIGRTGLVLTSEAVAKSAPEGGLETISTIIRISAGVVTQASVSQSAQGVTETKFSARWIPGTTTPTNSVWCDFLKQNAVWKGTGIQFNETYTVNFTESGYYHVEAAADDEGAIYVDNRLVVAMPRPGYNNSVSNLIYLEKGTYPVKVTALNSGGKAAGVACKITYTENGGLNNLPTPDTILQFGSPGFYHKRRDAFNFVYKIKGLAPGQYEVRARRTNNDEAEPDTGGDEKVRNYHTVSLLSVTAKGYEWVKDPQNPTQDYTDPITGKKVPQGPLNKLPRGNLARTAIRIQSTNKANGSVDGVNALVHSMVWDYEHTTDSWVFRASSNPASLFLHVLSHPANAYRIPVEELSTRVDLAAVKSWHDFCRLNAYEYNAVVTQTQSVLDTLRDICAAALASPAFVDGKWTVIVDRPRTYVTQHFTPHNSWGFESTKLLPRLPDAFRVTFPNRERAYQADETIVYNYGKSQATATVFEELSLPGVTNALQAKKLARWHLAQLKLRPEVYTLNVDFEYLVCNRGDLVRVNHDVPLWGTGSGRLKSVGSTTLGLTEPVYLVTGTTYQVRIRTNTGASVLRTLSPATSGWYNTVTVTTSLDGSGVEADNLFMIGEVSKESQELIVIGIEPSSNVTARLTLVDYSPQIYSVDLTDDNAELPSFDPNITGRSPEVLQSAITVAPIFTGATSDSDVAEQIANGTYQNVMILGFSNAPDLTDSAKKIQVQVALGNGEFDSSSLVGVYEADKAAGSVVVTGLQTLTTYKMRARYINATGSVSGPWSRIYYISNTGKTGNMAIVQNIDVVLDNTFIIATANEVIDKPSNFKCFEYRFYKDTGVEDFWDLDPATNGIFVVQSQSEGRLNLLDVPVPRISETGITYRVACRVQDSNNNYGSESALGTIVITTIQ